MANNNNGNWSFSWEDDASKAAPQPDEFEQNLLREAKERFKICIDWEAQARTNFEYDYKFANGDAHNKYQWDDDLVLKREGESRPCLTVNKVAQHNLMVINDSKQNKPGIRIRPVGGDSSYDAAQVFQEIIYHIEYISNAENIYDSAMTFQVEAGWGYWRLDTDYIADDTFDQEIYIRRIKDPRSVYLDPNITEIDGSDAWYGFIFDEMPKDVFYAKYPEFMGVVGNNTVLGEPSDDGWISKSKIRVAEYFRKTQKKDKLIHWINTQGIQILKKLSELNQFEKLQYDELKGSKEAKELYQYQERKVLVDDVQWYKIAGDRVIDQGKWLGKYIPIVRLCGVETVIDGILDRKGHTRALIDPQRMYNWNASADVEYGALQTKVPWIAASAAIEGFEDMYEKANSINYAYLPFNAWDDDGRQLPEPKRPEAPQASPAYVQRMQLSINEMMMASGQYQSQFGENENAKSGVAINARQRQGDRATYHFLDNQAIAIRLTGKMCLDLIGKIYDTKRVMRITARDGTIMNINIDPQAQQGLQQVATDETDKENKIKEIIFNPNVGTYDVQSDTGPSYATRRMEAFNALTQIAAQNQDFMHIGGDLFFKVADFPEADVLAQRYRRSIPPAILGEGPDQQTEQLMHQASDQIQKLTSLTAQQSKELADKDREFTIKEREIALREKEVEVRENRQDYDSESKRLTALGNAGPIITPEMIEPVIKQLLNGMIANDPTLIGKINNAPIGTNQEEEEPPVAGAKKANDGIWYVKQGDQYHKVEMQ